MVAPPPLCLCRDFRERARRCRVGTYSGRRAGSSGVSLGFALVALFVVSSPCFAQQTDHHVWTGSPSPSAPYSTWNTASHTVAPAVAAAQQGETVFIATGTYNREPAMTVQSGVHIRAGTLTLPAQTFTDGTCAATIIGSNAGPIFTCLGDAQICGVTLTNNKIPGEGAGIRANVGAVAISNSCLEHLEARDGAAVFATGTTLSLANTMVRHNKVSERGGGINQSGGTLTIPGPACRAPAQPCGFRHNDSDNLGGAIYVQEVDVDITHCDFEDNKALVDGGAIYAEHSNLTFDGQCQFLKNRAWNGVGGAIACVYTTMKDTGGMFEDNRAFGRFADATGGGGVHARGDGNSLELIGTQLHKNRCQEGTGGGVQVSGPVVLTCTGTRFDSNVTVKDGGNSDLAASLSIGSGGGLALRGGATATLDKDTVLTGNHAARDGGGLHGIDSGTTATLTETLFEKNTAADDGGGLSVTEGASLEATEAKFTENRAQGNFGGGTHATCGAHGTFTDCTYTKNKAHIAGGGAFLHNAECRFTGDETVFAGNETLTGRGGAIFARSNANVLVEGFCLLGDAVLEVTEGCSFTGNKSALGGGAIGMRADSLKVVDFRILGAHFTGNTGKSDEFSRLPIHGILAVNPGSQSSFPHSMADNDLTGPDKAGLAIGLFEESQEDETVDLARNTITRHTIGVHCSLGDTDFEGNEIKDMKDTGILFSHATGRLFQANHLIQNRVYQVQLQEESHVDIVETRLDGGGLSRFGISVDPTSDAFISMNDIYGHTRFGAEKLGAGPSVVTLQAIFNWWGHPSGANPPGSGDKISANVNAAFPRPAAFGW